MDFARRGEEAGVVVLRRGEGGVAVEEGQRLGVRGVETDFALAHFEANGGDGERRVVAVVDGYLDRRGALHVGAEGCGDAELLLTDLAAGLGEMDAEDGAGESFASEG